MAVLIRNDRQDDQPKKILLKKENENSSRKVIMKKQVIEFAEEIPEGCVLLLEYYHDSFLNDYDEKTKDFLEREKNWWNWYKQQYRPIKLHRAKQNLTYIIGTV